jgi:hypothetical protein
LYHEKLFWRSLSPELKVTLGDVISVEQSNPTQPPHRVRAPTTALNRKPAKADTLQVSINQNLNEFARLHEFGRCCHSARKNS